MAILVLLFLFLSYYGCFSVMFDGENFCFDLVLFVFICCSKQAHVAFIVGEECEQNMNGESKFDKKFYSYKTLKL